MSYSGPIDLKTLVDLDALCDQGAEHYTFLAFPKSLVNEYGLPADEEAQEYIAAVQATGVPVGIWLNSPIEDTGYAAVTSENSQRLRDAIEGLIRYHEAYASELCERLFRDAGANPG